MQGRAPEGAGLFREGTLETRANNEELHTKLALRSLRKLINFPTDQKRGENVRVRGMQIANIRNERDITKDITDIKRITRLQ